MEGTGDPQSRINAALSEIKRRADQDPAFKYERFDVYPWSRDPAFQNAFIESLTSKTQFSGPTPPELDIDHDGLLALALPVRITRFREATKGIEVDGDHYVTYRRDHPGPPLKVIPNPNDPQFNAQAMRDHGVDLSFWALIISKMKGPPLPEHEWYINHQSKGSDPPSTLPQHPDLPAASSAPSWQTAAPKAELFIDRSATQTDDSRSATTSGGGKEPYPKLFDDIIEHLTNGKEIPGIRKIPDTVISDPNISVTGRPAPAKPWEKNR